MSDTELDWKALEKIFYQGRCAEVLSVTVDRAFVSIPSSAWPILIGALAFLGRTPEAEWRFEAVAAELSASELIACRFYLGVGFTRASLYQKARQYFSQNLCELRRGPPAPRAAFFAWQGAGFFYHFRGRYRQSLQAATKALEGAVRSDFFFGRMLATDLLAHARIESGSIAHGLSELEMAHRLAHGLGHGSYEKAIYRAIVCYKAQYGLAPQDAVNSLRELIQEAKVQDTYTDNYLNLELARQLTLRGHISEAEECLQLSSRSIYATQHRRQRVLLNLRWAEIAYRRRDILLAQEKLQSALADIDPNIDLPLHLQYLGLAQKVGLPGVSQGPEQIASLTRRVGSGWAQRIAARQAQIAQHPLAAADDPLGDWLDKIAKRAGETLDLTPFLQQNYPYLGLLTSLLPFEAGARVIYFHLMPRVLFIYDRGDLRILESGHTPKLIDLLRALASGLSTKEELVKEVWGYAYHPLRHDTLLYTLISRLRNALGDCAGWLENTPQGYQLIAGVQVATQETPDRPPSPAPLQNRPADLNARQLKILEHLAEQEWIEIETCTQLFQTSKVTATRDLAFLVKAGLIQRVGKGRATRYAPV